MGMLTHSCGQLLLSNHPGSLSLETAPLKNSLRSEAASWKAQFAQNLHRQCSEDLKAFDKCVPFWGLHAAPYS